jgi:hypothetical protein
MNRKNYITAFLIVAVMAVVSASSKFSKALGNASVELSHMRISPGPIPSITAVTGFARNISGERMKLIYLSFKLYDASGSVVATAVAQTSNLGVDEIWRYEALGSKPFTTAKLTDITVYK